MDIPRDCDSCLLTSSCDTAYLLPDCHYFIKLQQEKKEKISLWNRIKSAVMAR